MDLTRPFPSPEEVMGFDPEWCWNHWLSSPFERAGMRRWCAVLLQGVACSRKVRFGAADADAVSVCLISRKSIANPGTRYNARGLNGVGGVGNEIESELITWWEDGHAGIGRFSTLLCRRGTVPVCWKHELHSSVSQPKIVLSDTPYEGVEDYFEGVHERYGGRPIVVVNLLRCDTESGETALSETFQQSLREARTRLEARGGRRQELVMCNFDWHRLKKELGMDMSVKGLWERLTPHLEASGLTEGCWESGGRGGMGGFTVERQQASVMRFNCLDSLDRTNLCCFMVAQQVCLEQC